jgi:hypothetical protein
MSFLLVYSLTFVSTDRDVRSIRIGIIKCLIKALSITQVQLDHTGEVCVVIPDISTICYMSQG